MSTPAVDVSVRIDAEMAYIGAVMLHPSEHKLDIVRPEHFWRPAHRRIVAAMASLVAKGLDTDFIAMRNELGVDALREVGGENYLLEVCQYVPSAENWRTYADIVLEMAQRRAYLEKAKKVQALVLEEAPIDEIAAVDAETPDVGLISRAPIIAIGDIFLSEEEVPNGITTGFRTLDDLIETHGYPLGQTTVVSAYHKGGKSTFMLSSFAHLAARRKRVMYATFADLNQVRLKRRLLRNLTGWSKAPIRDLLALDDFKQAQSEIDTEWKAWMYDATKLGTGGDIETFTRWIESAHSKYRFDCIFVDYAQKITSSSRKANSPVSEQDICSTVLSRCAERTGIAIVVGSQITEGKGGDRAMTKGSRKWEEDAGWVLRITGEEEGTREIEVAYSRYGVQGVKKTFGWNVERLRFEDRGQYELDPFEDE